MDDRETGVRFPAGAKDLSPHYRVQTVLSAETACYMMFAGGPITGDRVKRPGREAVFRRMPWLRMFETIPPFPHTPSCCGAQ
jgi:hypothetical protein